MAELFKNIYSRDFFDSFLSAVNHVQPGFNEGSFLDQIYTSEWEEKELKQRMRHIAITLQQHLSGRFPDDIQTLLKIIPKLLDSGFKADNLEFMFFPDFVEVYGIEDYETSVHAFERITQFVSCEFAVRPFIVKYPKRMVAQMFEWSNHEHPMVRRLSSEGSRPRLPWAMALPDFKKDPSVMLPILENLKNDPSESVRRSVANNLNDISKDNPTLVVSLARKWLGASSNTDKLVKHACRSLLKSGHSEVMRLFDFGAIKSIKIDNLQILNPEVHLRDFLVFSFNLVNTSNKESKIRLEYAVYYQKANGTLSKKVYKISEKQYAGNSTTNIIRKQPFKLITTRKFHLGKHQLALVVNGNELEKLDFHLIDP